MQDEGVINTCARDAFEGCPRCASVLPFGRALCCARML